MQKNFEGKIYLSSELRAPRVEESPRPAALESSSRTDREVVLYKPPQSRSLREAKTLVSLLHAASADLYLKNSFRVLKKHVHSPLADIDAALSGSIAIEASKPQTPDHRLFSRYQASPNLS